MTSRRRNILPLLATMLVLAVLPRPAEAVRLGLMEVRLDTVLIPSLSADAPTGSFQLLRFGIALEPSKQLYFGLGASGGYFSASGWPLFSPGQSPLAVGWDLFLRHQPAFGPGLRPGFGVTFDGAFTMTSGSGAPAGLLAGWLDLIGVAWTSSTQALAFTVSPGLGFAGIQRTSTFRPLLKISAAFQF